MKDEVTFPLEVPSGSAVVRIFRRVSNRGYECFTITYYEDGKRKRAVLSDFAKVKKRAKKIADALGVRHACADVTLANGNRDWLARLVVVERGTNRRVKRELTLSFEDEQKPECVEIGRDSQ
jgi:hypothetical protein